MPSNPTDAQQKPYATTVRKDLGAALDGLMELTAKSRTLVLIAALFFIAYWLVAGPGVYFFLNGRKRAEMSWFMFGASAIAATALTVLVVKLVVRGVPELSHVTFVREAPGQPALAISRMGLYIPQDGNQQIALRDTAPNHVSYLTAFPIHPKHVTADNQFPAQLPYEVPVREAGADAPAALSVPYRSTLKKFEAHWVGQTKGGLDGSAQLVVLESNSILEGQLGNRTGKDLKNVYFVYRDLTASHDDDEMFYLPVWEKDRVVDLQREFFQDRPKFVGENGATPDDHIKLQYILGRPGQDFGWVALLVLGLSRAGFHGCAVVGTGWNGAQVDSDAEPVRPAAADAEFPERARAGGPAAAGRRGSMMFHPPSVRGIWSSLPRPMAASRCLFRWKSMGSASPATAR